MRRRTKFSRRTKFTTSDSVFGKDLVNDARRAVPPPPVPRPATPGQRPHAGLPRRPRRHAGPAPRHRLVAVTCASNAVGTPVDVRQVCRLACDAGALTYLDAVHYAPHGPIDVQDWGCDFLACSAYKFFGPHVGVLWGRRELLERLPAYKLRPVPNVPPDRWMTGTQNHEGLAGAAAAVDYLADVSARSYQPEAP